jgi:putative FmdB family regulatory protein
VPLYEYQCEKCGEAFEVMQKFTDLPLTTHEKCGGPVHRILSPPALQFKGSGWYITDYAKGSTSSSASSEDGAGKSDSTTKAEAGGTSGKETSSKSSVAGSEGVKTSSSDKK